MKDTTKGKILGEEVLEVFRNVVNQSRSVFVETFCKVYRWVEISDQVTFDWRCRGRRSTVAYRSWLILLMAGIAGGLSAQASGDEDSGNAEWKMWSTAAMDIGFSKKAELSLGYLRSYALNHTMQNEFNQASASFSYDITKHLEAKTGYILTQSPASGKNTNRYYLRTMFKINLNEKFKWTNGLQAEKHSANERRFDYRFIFITRLELRKRIDFLSLTPSVTYWVFYNLGGSSIQYYDLEGHPTIMAAPDGIHRARLWLNLNSKISDAVSVSVYYLRQFEFNLVGQETHINVTNPVNGRIARPYSNYNVAGVTLKLNLDL